MVPMRNMARWEKRPRGGLYKITSDRGTIVLLHISTKAAKTYPIFLCLKIEFTTKHKGAGSMLTDIGRTGTRSERNT